MSEPLLSVEELRVPGVSTSGEISFELAVGGALALVGPAGSGCSEAALAPLRLDGRVEGRILFEGRDLAKLRERELRRIRGNEIAAVFGDPAGSLHPAYRIGWQLAEAVRAHRSVSKGAARDRAVDALEAVGVSDPHRRVDAYRRELPVRGQLRVLIAMALINRPKLLIVEDPFTKLEWVDRTAIVELLRDLRRRLRFAILLATADADVASSLADDVLAIDGGRIVELG